MHDFLRHCAADLREIAEQYREIAADVARGPWRQRILDGAVRIDWAADRLSGFDGDLDVAWSQDSDAGEADDLQPTRGAARAR